MDFVNTSLLTFNALASKHIKPHKSGSGINLVKKGVYITMMVGSSKRTKKDYCPCFWKNSGMLLSTDEFAFNSCNEFKN